MKHSRIFLAVVILLAVVAFGDEAPYTSETALRAIALKKVTPLFPAEAISAIRKTGVAVAYVTFDEKGDAIDVKVLESPHPSIQGLLIAALKQWKVRAGTIAGKPSKVGGKITFYYLVEKGVGRVASPDEVGVVDLHGNNACKESANAGAR